MGEPSLAEVLPLIYDELHALSGRMHAERGLSVHATSVVHETFLKLTASEKLRWTSRAHFLAIAAKAMRHILADRARSRGRAKRGGGWQRVPLENLAVGDHTVDVVALDQALVALREVDARGADVLEMRLLAGMTREEVSEVTGRSVRSIARDWRAARAWLLSELELGEER